MYSIQKTIWTIGHSKHSLDIFLELLFPFEIRGIVDVRRHPGSRIHPQFNRDALVYGLGALGITYHHMVDLGGLRESETFESRNTAWPESAFNAYADHMQTEPFQKSLQDLESLAQKKNIAILCAEANPLHCHRQLISDFLTTLGWQVTHIVGLHRTRVHELTSFAQIEDGKLIYPGGTLF